MISAKGLHHNDQKSFKLAELSEPELPASIQIFGSDPFIMAEAAYRLNGTKASFIDINMGCPVPKVAGSGEGCALMLDPELAAKVVREVCKASVKPVTVKIRKGWDDERANAVEIAKIAEQEGAVAIAVHGRTREQFYGGKADWSVIREVKNAVGVAVIGNGDITCPADAGKMFGETGCDAVMIGRAACGDPWIFRRTLKYLDEGVLEGLPLPEERKALAAEHMRMLVEHKKCPESYAVHEMRKHIAWYIKGVPNAARIREKVFRAESCTEVEQILEEAFPC
jgi:nifR3 family TIM-barrel protein